MKPSGQVWRGLAVFAVVSSLSFEAFAQVPLANITYAPAPSVVVQSPTLSQAGIVLLSFVLAVAGYVALRNSKAGRFLSSVFSVALAASLASTGFVMVRDARAGNAVIELTSSSGGVVPVWGLGDSQVVNTTSVPMLLTTIQPTSCNIISTPSHSPQCVSGSTILSPNSANSCWVSVKQCPD